MLLKRLRAPAAIAASLLLASLPALATWDVDILPPASPTAQDAYTLHWGIMYVCIVIFFVVFGAMFWSIFKHRKSAGAKAAQFHENTTIEIIWTIVPLVVLIAMAWPATRTMIEMKDASSADMSIKVTAYQWRWDYDYQQDGVHFISNLSTPRDQIDNYHGEGAPKEANYLLEVDRPLVVPAGKKVRLLITSNDVIHGFYVPQLGVHQYGIPGFVKDAWFSADKPGIYRGQCSQICGKEHAYMPIVVDVRSPEDYAAWVKAEKAKMPPAPPAAPVEQQAPAQASAAAPQQVAAAGAPAPAGGKGAANLGKTTFDGVCTACHSTGVAGAPKVGDKAAWAPRIAKGKDQLYHDAIHGLNAMPPKGGNAALPDDAVKAAVDYMVSQAR
ncbi:MAG TPA: cytochrome c oxidase subunit II [Usitatibacter sp.]|jgi:cytochrome c oxidase subunit 2|nr:cytochrome c oxidase subunit II [Usitatibacter sp.]